LTQRKNDALQLVDNELQRKITEQDEYKSKQTLKKMITKKAHEMIIEEIEEN